MKLYYKILIFFLLALIIFKPANAQTADDGFTMQKGQICIVAGYKQSTWTNYWEGEKLRDNKNIGVFTSKIVMPMVAYGITNKLNVFASLPYISNSSNAGNMTGKKGLQDISVEAKYTLFNVSKKGLHFKLLGTVGFSLPSNKYVPDFLPFSIGIGSKTAHARLIAHAHYKDGLFATVQTGFIARSNITVERITYYTDRQYYSSDMRIPNVWDGSVKLGYDNKYFRAYTYYSFSRATSGTDIRLNDMPYPGNNMQMQSAGISGLVWVQAIKGLGVNAMYDAVLAGRNVGKATSWSVGLQYFFEPFKKKNNATIKK
ncbi:MAG: hypothetical protein H7101_07760 [Deinococcales bacterium]|nr:hypothetical protein [Chitinophagaceae bacterium]